MEVGLRVWSAPAWTDSALYVVGVLTTSVFLIRLLVWCSQYYQTYLIQKISKQTDLISKYGKWAVITGGTDGIGKGCAMELAKRGMNICVISNFENNTVSDIQKKYDVKVKWIDADFSTPEPFDRIEKELSLLDDIGILINNVGMVQSKWQPLVEQDREFLKKILNVNVTAMVLTTEIVLKGMVQKNKGLIVNMGSQGGICPLPYATMYSASKGFVENYSHCLAAELNETQVRVKCVQPFFVRTQMLKGMPSLVDNLDRPIIRWSFPQVQAFTASLTQTFGNQTPVALTGHWLQELFTIIVPYSVGKQTMATTLKHTVKWLSSYRPKHDVTFDKL